MEFEIYCDESRPDLFWSKDKKDKYLLIGGVWIKAERRQILKNSIAELKAQHDFDGPIKWKSISSSRIDFHTQLIDLFVCWSDEDIRFRCIAVKAEKVNMLKYNQNDSELGFYKFYYQLLHHWILDWNSYRIFVDAKTNRLKDRLEVLRRCLQCSNLTSEIKSIQALPSNESIFIQMADFLTGITGSRMNNSIQKDGTKDRLIQHAERSLKRPRLAHTPKNEPKFNIFEIELRGGW